MTTPAAFAAGVSYEVNEMKKMIPVLITTHLLCILLGFGLGRSRLNLESIPEHTAPTGNSTEVTVETENTETTELTIPTEETAAVTEVEEEPTETTEATEATKEDDIPVYIPSATTPPVVQPSVTEPSATEPPATQPPATEPPPTNPPATEAPPVESAPPITDDNMGEWT